MSTFFFRDTVDFAGTPCYNEITPNNFLIRGGSVMTHIFKERGITAERVKLKFDHVLFSNAPNKHFSPDKMVPLIAAAEKHLETPIPLLPLST